MGTHAAKGPKPGRTGPGKKAGQRLKKIRPEPDVFRRDARQLRLKSSLDLVDNAGIGHLETLH